MDERAGPGRVEEGPDVLVQRLLVALGNHDVVASSLNDERRVCLLRVHRVHGPDTAFQPALSQQTSQQRRQSRELVGPVVASLWHRALVNHQTQPCAYGHPRTVRR